MVETRFKFLLFIFQNKPIFLPSQYTDFEYLAKGSFGVVCTALLDGVAIAVKKVHCHTLVFAESALRELHNLAFFACKRADGICPMLDCWIQQADPNNPGSTFIYMALRKYNCSLEAYSKLRAPLSPTDWRKVCLLLMKALDDMHHKGGMHRDLKPENVVTTADCSEVALIDLGSIRAIDASKNIRPLTPIFQVATEGYRAPEIIGNEVGYDDTFDVFAAGCVLAEMRMKRELFPTQEDADEFAALSDDDADCFLRAKLHMCSKKDLAMVLTMLHRDPRQRATPSQIISELSSSLNITLKPSNEDHRNTYIEPVYDPLSHTDILRALNEVVEDFAATMESRKQEEGEERDIPTQVVGPPAKRRRVK